MARVAANNPFLPRQSDLSKLHVTSWQEPPEDERKGRLVVPAGEPDELALVGPEVYLNCPNGYGRTKLNNAYVETRLGVAATTRNWKTVIKLRDLAGA